MGALPHLHVSENEKCTHGRLGMVTGRVPGQRREQKSSPGVPAAAGLPARHLAGPRPRGAGQLVTEEEPRAGGPLQRVMRLPNATATSRRRKDGRRVAHADVPPGADAQEQTRCPARVTERFLRQLTTVIRKQRSAPGAVSAGLCVFARPHRPWSKPSWVRQAVHQTGWPRKIPERVG